MRRSYRVPAAAVVIALAAVSLTPAPASAAPPAGPLTASRVPSRPGPARPRVVAVAPIPPGEKIVQGLGDSSGWHLYEASSGDGWRWHPLATIAPDGGDVNGERWIGQQCLTGDGRAVVAVIAPWHANNDPAGMQRGGIAYVIDARTGAVRPLVGGISLAYFNPSCGPGALVALTRYTGPAQQATQVIAADTSTNAIASVQTVTGEVTSAVPAPHGVFAVRGAELIGISAGVETVKARLPGVPFDLVASAHGGVDFLVGTGRTHVSLWQFGERGARRVGSGKPATLKLYPGAGGHSIVIGGRGLQPGTGFQVLAPTVAALLAVSQRGTKVVLDGSTSPGRPQPSSGRLGAAPGGVTAPAATGVPLFLTDPPSARTSSGRTFQSTCAVPRNHVDLQTFQPPIDPVDWAANLAGQGQLRGANATRPANYANLGLPAYQPSLDLPLPAPFGPNAKSVPRLVLEGIFAQESNWNQASWHAVPGLAGNPLIADYYGAGSGYVPGVYTPDCGYGLGQLTDIMVIGAASYDLQRKISVDYAENAAAAAQAIAQKWDDLSQVGIIANLADPSRLEDWYFAIWAYNTGLHPDTGSGPWGVGWLNNPANPVYPYFRHPFLYDDTTGVITYGDAANPGQWPYQEKVYGWMEVPLKSPQTGDYSYQGLGISPGDKSGVISGPMFAMPDHASFCTTDDNCSVTINGNGTVTVNCTAPQSECWWHQPASWCDSLQSGVFCNSDTWTRSVGDPEPPLYTDFSTTAICDVDTTAVPPGSTVVDTQAGDLNLQKCSQGTNNWTNRGTFVLTFGPPGSTTGTDMDLHQLGAGLGGHMWFSHTGEPTTDWGVTGTWAATALAKGRYDVKVFVPATGATSPDAGYVVSNGLGISHTVTLNQNAYTDTWVSLGRFWLGPGATVTLSNLTSSIPGDLAFTGLAFVPARTGLYVMLGDSYSSGEGAGQYDPATTGAGSNGVNTGHRSPLAYNRYFASHDTTVFASGGWSDAACSGALIPDYYATNSNGRCPNEPGQKSAVSGDVSLITMTFGGNDLAFAPIMKACVLHGLLPSKYPTCQSQYPNLAQQIKNLANPTNSGGLPQLYQNIRAAAPNAEIVVLGYPHLVRPSTDPNGGCVASGKIMGSDRDWLNRMADLMDSEIQPAATQAGFTYISVNQDFDNHELCSSSPWLNGPSSWAAFLKGTVSPETQQQWFHPNPAGYAYEASRLAGVLPIP